MKTIVITGCSSGFGRATALRLAGSSVWRVWATVRRDEDRDRLQSEAAGLPIDVILCDVTDRSQVSNLAETVSAATSTLDALLNNAGTAFPGPLELLPLDALRAQLEVNVVAPVALTQALLPLLKAGRGTILNVSSVGGRVTYPITGAYHASKFALEALSDSLRIELAPFGVKVVVVEPGGSPTAIWDHGEQNAGGLLADPRAEMYRPLMERYRHLARASARRGFPPEDFARLIERILADPQPSARYALPARVGWLLQLRRLLPDWFWDGQIRRVFRW
jgi:NAD(P)-dependent dehydrogenase (short-subunit alcohol dehydrogenase family)